LDLRYKASAVANNGRSPSSPTSATSSEIGPPAYTEAVNAPGGSSRRQLSPTRAEPLTFTPAAVEPLAIRPRLPTSTSNNHSYVPPTPRTPSRDAAPPLMSFPQQSRHSIHSSYSNNEQPAGLRPARSSSILRPRQSVRKFPFRMFVRGRCVQKSRFTVKRRTYTPSLPGAPARGPMLTPPLSAPLVGHASPFHAPTRIDTIREWQRETSELARPPTMSWDVRSNYSGSGPGGSSASGKS
jgi:hypothetical protein